jgi:glycosyltransferase involved in cell wall biosynthesis
MNGKAKVLYIFHVSVIGGGSFCLLNIIKNLDRERFLPIVLLKKPGPLATELSKLGATVYFEKRITTVLYNKSIFKISSIRQLIDVFISIPKIIDWYRKINPDIIHLNTMMLYPYLHGASKLKIQTVLHMREHWPKNEHQIQFKFARNIIDKYTDMIVAINQTSADILGLMDKTIVIHDYISFEGRDETYNFESIFGKDYQELKIFSFFGGTNWQKGALQVIDTFVKHIKDTDIRLLVVGGGEKKIIYKGLKGILKKELARFNYYRYNDKVRFIAQKDSRIIFVPGTYQIKSIIEQSSAVVSAFSIPHANLTMAEASVLGVPSIAANTPEAKEYSNNGNSALLFEMNNKKDFIDKIRYFLDHTKLIKRKAEVGSDNMTKIFSVKANSVLLDRMYCDLLSGKKTN